MEDLSNRFPFFISFLRSLLVCDVVDAVVATDANAADTTPTPGTTVTTDTVTRAEKIASQMITEERLNGSIDSILYVESSEVLTAFDRQIQSLCFRVNNVIEKSKAFVTL